MLPLLQALMIYSCETSQSLLPGYENEGAVVKIVRSTGREATMYMQLAADPAMQVLPLVTVITDVVPGLSALVTPRGDGLLSWASLALTSRDVARNIVQLMKVE